MQRIKRWHRLRGHWYDTTANDQTYVMWQVFKQLHDKFGYTRVRQTSLYTVLVQLFTNHQKNMPLNSGTLLNN